jgi:hypothetical protein
MLEGNSYEILMTTYNNAVWCSDDDVDSYSVSVRFESLLTHYHDYGFTWFLSVPPGGFRGSSYTGP